MSRKYFCDVDGCGRALENEQASSRRIDHQDEVTGVFIEGHVRLVGGKAGTGDICMVHIVQALRQMADKLAAVFPDAPETVIAEVQTACVELVEGLPED